VPRILLVDDDEDHLKLFIMILENKGFTLDSYSDSAAALSKFKSNYYDLLLLDYRMPKLNGLELFARIGEIDPTAKALLLTANHEQFTEGGLRVGQDYLRVITKPISNEKLLAEIDYTLNRPVNSLVSLENHDGNHQNLLLVIPETGNVETLHKNSVHSVTTL
jgi:two-component system response regulator ChvI